MKRFTFSLQSVQDQRTIQRERAEREFAEAGVEVANAAALLDRTIKERNAAIEAYTALLESRQVDPEEVALRANHITLLTQRERERRARLEQFQRAQEAKRQAVIATTRDEKAIDNLRERHRVRHETVAARLEQTALDEMATIGYVRRCE